MVAAEETLRLRDRRADFAMLYREFLQDDAREVYESKAREAGYHIFKDRKFVCTGNVEASLKAFLQKIEANNVVLGVQAAQVSRRDERGQVIVQE